MMGTRRDNDDENIIAGPFCDTIVGDGGVDFITEERTRRTSCALF